MRREERIAGAGREGYSKGKEPIGSMRRVEVINSIQFNIFI